jgi:hypothetical protein
VRDQGFANELGALLKAAGAVDAGDQFGIAPDSDEFLFLRMLARHVAVLTPEKILSSFSCQRALNWIIPKSHEVTEADAAGGGAQRRGDFCGRVAPTRAGRGAGSRGATEGLGPIQTDSRGPEGQAGGNKMKAKGIASGIFFIGLGVFVFVALGGHGRFFGPALMGFGVLIIFLHAGEQR